MAMADGALLTPYEVEQLPMMMRELERANRHFWQMVCWRMEQRKRAAKEEAEKGEKKKNSKGGGGGGQEIAIEKQKEQERRRKRGWQNVGKRILGGGKIKRTLASPWTICYTEGPKLIIKMPFIGFGTIMYKVPLGMKPPN